MAVGALLGQQYGIKSVNGEKPNINGDVQLKLDSMQGILPVEKGGTGATTPTEAVKNIVDNQEIKPTTVMVGLGRFYEDNGESGLDMNNSDITKLNAMYFGDDSASYEEGINFPTSGIAPDVSSYDTLTAYGGKLYFIPKRPKGQAGKSEVVYHSGNVVPVADGGTGATTAEQARTNLGIPKITNGTSVPFGGSDGDIYIQWTD